VNGGLESGEVFQSNVAAMAYPKNALLVDDESHVRAFVRLLLQEVGITECWEAADGVSAVLLAQQHKPELVLLDVNLPGLNGLQVLAQLKQHDPDLPVVMVTSQSAISTVSEALRLGAVGYLLKHCPKDETLRALRDVLESLDEVEPGAEA
jgi:two-component system chemotaxis response regulator CheY